MIAPLSAAADSKGGEKNLDLNLYNFFIQE